MKVLHVITGLGSGGAENMLFKLIASQQENEHLVVSINGKGVYYKKLLDIGVKVLVYEKNDYINPFSFVKLYSSVRQFAPEVVMSWMYHSFIFSLLLPKGKVNIWNVRHSLSDIKKDKYTTRMVIRVCSLFSFIPDKVCFNSKNSLNLHHEYGFNRYNSEFIPNGFSVDKFPVFGYDNQTIKFVNFSRFHPVKGHERLVKSFERFIRLSGIDAELHLYGSGIHQGLTLIQSMPQQVRNRIFIHGHSEFPEKVMFEHHVYISSSFNEAFPNVIGEALLSGLYVIATDVGDSAEIISDPILGTTISSVNFDNEIYDAMCTSLNYINDNRMSKYRHENVANKYSIEKVSKNYSEIYK